MRSYKRKKRRKKLSKVGRNIIIMISCLVCVFIATVILGNVLGKKADSINSETTDDTVQVFPDDGAEHTFNLSVPSVNADYFNMEGITNNQINSKISALPLGTKAVSVDILDKNGNPNYKSSVAMQFYGEEACNINLDLETFISRFEEKGIRLCFQFKFSAFEIKDKNVRIARTAYESAIIKEVASGGAVEILISGLGIVDDLSLNEYLALVKDIKKNCPDTLIGVSFEHTYYLNNTIATVLYAMSTVADFSAIDITNLNDDLDKSEFFEQNKYYINRYNLRILFTYDNSAKLLEFVSIFNDKEIYNWQVSG